jgi:feruloyl-CoA synthase
LIELAEPRVRVERREDGTLLLDAEAELGPYARCLGDLLVRNAALAPTRVYLGERVAGSPPEGSRAWRSVTWADALAQVRALAQALLEQGAGPERPLVILSGNSIAHALLALAAMHIGVPVVPVSVAYSLLSRDHAKLRTILERVTPGVVFVETLAPFAAALRASGLVGVPTLHRDPGHADDPLAFDRLVHTPVGPRVDAAFAALGPDTVAKILFTSGSTGQPKGVINTQRMLTSNQAALARLWPFLHAHAQPPEILDWLPWNHTFGSNFTFNLILAHAGTLWIDEGKPAPGAFAATLANLRERSPTLYFNVPRGFELLVPALERDDALAQRFFARLQLIFYAAAALPQNLWTRLEALALRVRGEPVLMASAWGSTETAPCSTAVHWPIDRAGVIGNPMPGTTIKLVPNAGKLELRVRGPNVMPGYFREPLLSAAAFDDEGFYRIGDAGKLADPTRPERGLVFDGRVAEDFKLSSGTWVHVGKLRVELIAACEPLVSDCVIAGHDRPQLGVLVIPNLAACRELAELDADASVEQVLASPRVREAIAAGLAAHAHDNPGSSTCVQRAMLLAEPPSIDANEITDKGYINQRAMLTTRAASLAALFGDAPDILLP